MPLYKGYFEGNNINNQAYNLFLVPSIFRGVIHNITINPPGFDKIKSD